jgi:hypothetical protein
MAPPVGFSGQADRIRVDDMDECQTNFQRLVR